MQRWLRERLLRYFSFKAVFEESVFFSSLDGLKVVILFD